jgi:hypothetical protein
MYYNLNLIRNIARSFKWQTLYRKSKDISCIQLFANSTDLSEIQLAVLQWLEVYNVLDQDLNQKRPFIDEDVIKDDIRVEAYLAIRQEILDKENDKGSKNKKPDALSPGHSVYFRKG